MTKSSKRLEEQESRKAKSGSEQEKDKNKKEEMLEKLSLKKKNKAMSSKRMDNKEESEKVERNWEERRVRALEAVADSMESLVVVSLISRMMKLMSQTFDVRYQMLTLASCR